MASKRELSSFLSEWCYKPMDQSTFKEFCNAFKTVYRSVYGFMKNEPWTDVEFQDEFDYLGLKYRLVSDVRGNHFIYPIVSSDDQFPYKWAAVDASNGMKSVECGFAMIDGLAGNMKRFIIQNNLVAMIGNFRVATRPATLSEIVLMKSQTVPIPGDRDMIHRSVHKFMDGMLNRLFTEEQEQIELKDAIVMIGKIIMGDELDDFRINYMEDLNYILRRCDLPFELKKEDHGYCIRKSI